MTTAPRPSREIAGKGRTVRELRAELRKAKQFALADRVRDRLGDLGVELRDGADGTTWTLSPSRGAASSRS
jgi:cysteinyl-tRNA synthetase